MHSLRNYRLLLSLDGRILRTQIILDAGHSPQYVLILFHGRNPSLRLTVAITCLRVFQSFAQGEYSRSSSNPDLIKTRFGNFPGYHCNINKRQPVFTIFFFYIYLILTAWVIMSLFSKCLPLKADDAFLIHCYVLYASVGSRSNHRG